MGPAVLQPSDGVKGFVNVIQYHYAIDRDCVLMLCQKLLYSVSKSTD
jgi:hypothetical protein